VDDKGRVKSREGKSANDPEIGVRAAALAIEVHSSDNGSDDEGLWIVPNSQLTPEQMRR
jgi:hypothetical protein